MTGDSRWPVRKGLLVAVAIAVLAIALAGGVTGDSGTSEAVVEPQQSGVHVTSEDAPSEIAPNENFKMNFTLRNYNETQDDDVAITLLLEGYINESKPFETVPANGTLSDSFNTTHPFNEGETFNWTLRVDRVSFNPVLLDRVNGTTTVNSTDTGTEPSGPFRFPNQAPFNDNVTIKNVSSSQDVAVMVTYPDNGSETVVGITNGTYNQEDVNVTLGNTSGVPGTHNAYKVRTTNLSSAYQANDTLSATTENNALANDSALVGLDVTGNGMPASDTTGDGQLNDVDGDGSFDIFDVQALHVHRTDVIVQNNPALFGFASTNDVTILDVQELFNSL